MTENICTKCGSSTTLDELCLICIMQNIRRIGQTDYSESTLYKPQMKSNLYVAPDSIQRRENLTRDVVSNIGLGQSDFRVRNLLSSEIPSW